MSSLVHTVRGLLAYTIWADRQVLRDHAAERHADHVCALDAERVEQPRGVVAVLLHGVRAFGDARLAEPALVVGDDVEALGRQGAGEPRPVSQVAARPVDEQERRAVARAGALVVDVELAHAREGHGAPPA